MWIFSDNQFGAVLPYPGSYRVDLGYVLRRVERFFCDDPNENAVCFYVLSYPCPLGPLRVYWSTWHWQSQGKLGQIPNLTPWEQDLLIRLYHQMAYMISQMSSKHGLVVLYTCFRASCSHFWWLPFFGNDWVFTYVVTPVGAPMVGAEGKFSKLTFLLCFALPGFIKALVM